MRELFMDEHFFLCVSWDIFMFKSVLSIFLARAMSFVIVVKLVCILNDLGVIVEIYTDLSI